MNTSNLLVIGASMLTQARQVVTEMFQNDIIEPDNIPSKIKSVEEPVTVDKPELISPALPKIHLVDDFIETQNEYIIEYKHFEPSLIYDLPVKGNRTRYKSAKYRTSSNQRKKRKLKRW